MSSTKFIVYNEDLKMCGNYDYNNKKLKIYFLPLNKKGNLCKESCEIINAKSQPKQDYDKNKPKQKYKPSGFHF